MRIQHNIMAMNAYRNYNTNTSALSSNLEKLSSGYKINRAGDDAAGLAISEKMRAQISGLEQASSNVKDGISLVKTGEGAMQEIQDMLNRMVTLATQSANGTYDDDVDRDNLQKEVTELQSEIDRIADSANFNGIQLLNGNLDTSTVAGASTIADSAISVVSKRGDDVQEVKPEFTVSLNGVVFSEQTQTSGTATVATLTVGGDTVDLKLAAAVATGKTIDIKDLSVDAGTKVTINNYTYDVSIKDGELTFKAATTNSALTTGNLLTGTLSVSIADNGGSTKIDSTSKGPSIITSGMQGQNPGTVAAPTKQAQATFALTADMVSDGATITIGKETYTFDWTTSTSSGTTIGVKDLLDSTGKAIATAATVNNGKNMSLLASRLTKAAAGNSNFLVGFDGTNVVVQSRTGTDDDLSTDDLVKAQISGAKAGTSKSKGLSLQIGDTSETWNVLNVSIKDVHVAALGVGASDISIKSQSAAQTAISVIKKAINTVSSNRGTLGATQNRLEHTANNLSVMTENIQDAESTIRDTDIAEEMMSYTKNNILVQSAQAMLAQANSVPQGVLQLLQ